MRLLVAVAGSGFVLDCGHTLCENPHCLVDLGLAGLDLRVDPAVKLSSQEGEPMLELLYVVLLLVKSFVDRVGNLHKSLGDDFWQGDLLWSVVLTHCAAEVKHWLEDYFH